MPGLFYAISSWVTNRRWPAIALAVLLLSSMVAFGVFVAYLPNGPIPSTLHAAIIIGLLFTTFWLTMVVVWFDPRQRPGRGSVNNWSHAIFLDLFLVFVLAILAHMLHSAT
jgi:Na+/phosphate symporter